MDLYITSQDAKHYIKANENSTFCICKQPNGVLGEYSSATITVDSGCSGRVFARYKTYERAEAVVDEIFDIILNKTSPSAYQFPKE